MNKNKLILISLAVLVVLLLVLHIFVFDVLQKKYTEEEVSNIYLQGQFDAINLVLRSIQENGKIVIPISETESITLIPLK